MSGSNQSLSLDAPANPLDKIFYEPEPSSVFVAQSADPNNPTLVTVPFSNPAGTTFFIDMQVSVNNETWYDSGFEPYYVSSGIIAFVRRFAGTWSMTSSAVTLSFFANDSDHTIYYRLIGYSKV